MTDEHKAFLDALAENEDDSVTRMVYADWLDEHDMPEEADRMRKWPEAKAWLKQFTRNINYSKYVGGERVGKSDTDPHSYEDVIQAGYDIRNRDGYCFESDAGADYFREGEHNTREFFKHWSIVTGESVPDEVIEYPDVH